MGITHVIRGEDHISNTPRQVLLYRGVRLDAAGRLRTCSLRARARSRAALEASRRDVGEGVPRSRISAGGADQLPGADRLVAGRGRRAAAARRAGQTIPARGRRAQRRRVRRREAGVGEPPLSEDGRSLAGSRSSRCRICSRPDGSRQPTSADLEFLTHVVPAAAASVDRAGAGAAAAGVSVRLFGARARSSTRRSLRRRRRARAVIDALAEDLRRQRSAARSRGVPRRGDARAREDRAEGQGAVSSDPPGADRRGRGPRARSGGSGDRARRRASVESGIRAS